MWRDSMKRTLLGGLGFALVSLFFTGAGSIAGPANNHVLERIAKGDLKPAKITVTQDGKTVTKNAPFISNGTLAALQSAFGVAAGDQRLEGADAASPGDLAIDGTSGSTTTGSRSAHL